MFRRTIVHHHYPSSMKKMRCRGLYLVADMDGTLTPTPTKSGGYITPLSKSPAFEPLQRFLLEGGKLVVETNAGTFPFRQIFDPLKSTLEELPNDVDDDAGRLVLCPFSGAGLFVSSNERDESSNNNNNNVIVMKEDENFAATARSYVLPPTSSNSDLNNNSDTTNNYHYYTTYGDEIEDQQQQQKRELELFSNDPTTYIPEAQVYELVQVIRETMIKVVELCDEDPTYLPLLSKKYRDALPKLIDIRRQYKNNNNNNNKMDEFNREVLSLENLLKYGKFLDKTNDPLIDLQRVSSGGLVQINILGTAMARFDYLFPPTVRKQLSKKYSIHIKRQPNSTTISKDQVNKGLPILFLANHKRGKERRYCTDFSLDTAIALGDHPQFTDYPMTQFPPMPFVSVAKFQVAEQREWPYKTRMIHLSDEEEGTAEYVEKLVDFCVKRNSGGGGESGEIAKNWWKCDYALEVGKSCKRYRQS